MQTLLLLESHTGIPLFMLHMSPRPVSRDSDNFSSVSSQDKKSYHKTSQVFLTLSLKWGYNFVVLSSARSIMGANNYCRSQIFCRRGKLE